MQSNNDTKEKSSRILYMVAAGTLCLGVALTGILVSRRKAKKVDRLPDAPDVAVNQTVEPATEPPATTAPGLPTFGAPATGMIAKRHDTEIPVYSATMQEYRVHSGIDVMAPVGTGVYAAAKGVVEAIYDDPLLGRCVRISHTGDGASVYCNLAPELAENILVGRSVAAGQLIGCIGETSMVEMADEPHLHFEMTVGGVPVDPLDYISASAQAAAFSEADEAWEG
ncbi:MAG: M23 family metallopeptidase [Clostridia bacterium]|nr:M23 family metallopeptidase [Clostridia bacterium]